MSSSFLPHGLQHTRLPCLSPTPRACFLYIHTYCSGNDRQVSLPTYPAAVPARSPPLSWGPGCCGSGCSGSPAATFKGANSMDPDLSSAASLDPRMPRLAQCAGTACSRVHCLGPTWTSPHLHARCAKCHASACVHAPMSHRLSPTKLRLKDRKHLDGANRE